MRGGVVVYGPSVAPGTELRVWSPLDVAPTLLWLRGFPSSMDMKGRVRDELMDERWRSEHPLRTISSYGKTSVPALPGTLEGADDEALERLRSLGYVN